ncbi:D-glycero-beta-D-manno-heptose 1,7-bisphosphate 7-phosphatase [Pelistega suis]|uniref:D-glycero-beta-D-manno-heptose 1,7-bisphosphate 7-phosphatase n=1 Tax=Pelistega suis TaxID=1631957 RepID=UPI00211CC77C|nr:D-glycero-beta-D-manno-heptose 1,7-bisphosphate 7-phosphatase [Pelistega suis]MCQ9328936.1 D-glycero-beta-D-manno-heptose 1,7-bisphosphate 7-phosphatase [Pelistega suis]
MKLIILDRDGVINHESAEFVKNADEWIALPGSIEAIAQLYHAGYKVVVATNQSGLGRGLFTIHDLNAMHKKLQSQLKALGASIDAFFICPHHPDEQCDCRKPLPGMFNEIKKRYGITDSQQFFAVGDSLRDLQAATSAGFKTWLVLTGNGQKTLENGNLPAGTLMSTNLSEVVEKLLEE